MAVVGSSDNGMVYEYVVFRDTYIKSRERDVLLTIIGNEREKKTNLSIIGNGDKGMA